MKPCELHLIFISSWMRVSIYLFRASLYIHNMNNAGNVNQMADREQCLQASFWKINLLVGSLASTSSAAPETWVAAEKNIPSFLVL